MPPALYEAGPNGVWTFLLATVLLGGLAAWVTGRSIAETWRPYWQIPVYMVMLAASVRFIHYAIFQAKLLSWRSFLVDLLVLLALAALSHVLARRRQMALQYGWKTS
ncbi:MAG TPA: hypothetical protein PK264_13820 [Hyphomicrobiaceae bacterium]|nr:hypothetical protein [Hyphomicrobiaceae bacterium]